MIVRRAADTAYVPFTLTEKARLIAEVAAAYVRVRRRLRGRTPHQVADLIRHDARSSVTGGRELTWFALRLGRVVEKNLDHLPGDTRCLTRSLVLLDMLARRGIASTVVIGVQPAPSFAAHAWVELDGQALLNPIEYAAGRLHEF